jgi:DNA-binding response OmpR family regulator
MSARILVIEDDQDFRDLLAYQLTAAGYTLLTAQNGQEGLEKARAETPDLILTDLMLPKLNGYEVCSLLKQDVRYAHIPILMLSATKMADKDEQLAKQCGASEYLLKTLEPKKLLEKVKEALAGTRSA